MQQYTFTIDASYVVLVAQNATFIDLHVSSDTPLTQKMKVILRQAAPPFADVGVHELTPDKTFCRLAPGFLKEEGPLSIYFEPNLEEVQLALGVVIA